MTESPRQHTVTGLLRSIGRSRLASCIVWTVLLGGGALGAISMLLGDHFSERMTARTLLGGIALCIGFIAWRWRRLARRLSLRGLCEAYQRECPEDRNALDAAVELETQKGRLTPFQTEYLNELHERYLAADGDALKTSRALGPCWRPVAMGLITVLCCGLCVAGRAAWSRLWNYAFGNESVVIDTLPESVAIHTDLVVSASVQRYGGSEMWLESVIDGVRRCEKMSMDGNGGWRIVLYDMTEEARFRALTKYGASKWRRVGCHIPPAPDSISLDVISPEYSGLEIRHYDEFQDIEMLDGSRVLVDCEMPRGQSWGICAEDGSLAAVPIVKGGRYSPHYVNGGIIAEGNAFQVTVIPDEAPVIEMVSPEGDSEIAPGQGARVVAVVTDDFGVSSVSLHYVVDDAEEKIIAMNVDGAGGNVSVDTPVAFGELEAGQVVTGWLEAVDNCVPEAHASRGPLFFMTVIPPKGEGLDGNDGRSDDQSGEKQEMAVNDLIVESKRLLRETIDFMDREKILDSNSRQQGLQTLSRELRSLSSAVTGRQVAIARNAGLEELPEELAIFFKSASEALNTAGDLVESDAVAESRKPQQKALAQLTRLAWLLLKNSPQVSTGDHGESQNDGQKNKGSQKSQTQKGDRNFDIEELHKALDQVKAFRRRQQELLRDMSVSHASDERKLAEAANAVGSKVAAIASAAGAVPPLRDASREMLGAAVSLDSSDVANGILRGQRAEIALGIAEDLLEEALRKESSEQLTRLAEKADELSKEQRELASHSREYGEKGASVGEKRSAREAQKELEKKSQSFRDEAAASLRSLSRQYPDASEKLSEVFGSRFSEQVQKAQTRANNALLYGRFDRAQESQDLAADALEQWRDEFMAANDAIPRFTPEELQQALEEMQRHAESLARAEGSAEMQARQDAARMLQEYAERFRSEELDALGEAVANGTREEALAALQTARNLMREELAKLMGADLLNAVKQSAPPPKKYRLQTQEYFKRLGGS